MKLNFLIFLQLLCVVGFTQNEANVLPVEGNVGIGTDSATCKLDVRGQTRMEGQVLIDGNLIVVDSVLFQDKLAVSGNTELQGDVKIQNLGTYSIAGSQFEIVIIDSDGQLKKGGISIMVDEIYSPPASLDYCGAMGGIAQWFAGPDKLITGCPDVNVGIATTDPLHKLHVVGTTYAQKFLAGNVGANSNALMNIFAQNNSELLIQLGVKIGGLDEEVRFVITNDGAIEAHNVGSDVSFTLYNGTGHALIVYSSDDSKILQLQDNGLLNTREVRVNTHTWPDYVFHKNHQLMSLGDTKMFIKKNGRLPGVPSAKKIVEDGLNLGEMQVLQMEKIEEIYLHIIELDERVKTLEEENKKLQKENKELKNK